MTSLIARSQEYLSFRSTVPLRKIAVDDDDSKYWTVYDAGPRTVKCPVIFFPPVSGTADVFFRQMLGLSAKGYRIISLEYPVHWTLEDLCISFRKLLDHMQLDMVHIFGSSLGSFIAQKFAEYTYRSPRVCSLILCNAFIDTEVFQQTGAAQTLFDVIEGHLPNCHCYADDTRLYLLNLMIQPSQLAAVAAMESCIHDIRKWMTHDRFWMVPGFLLKRMVLNNFSREQHDSEIADSIDFIVERLESLNRSDLASRLMLNCASAYVEPQKLHALDITLIDVFDDCAISQLVREETYKCYPDAKRAHLKSGGNFPYLSRSDEVNLHIQIHLRKYTLSRYDPKSPQEDMPEIHMEVGISGDSCQEVEYHGDSRGKVGDHGDSTGEERDHEGERRDSQAEECSHEASEDDL